MELANLRMPVDIGSSLDALAEWLLAKGLTRQAEQGTKARPGVSCARSIKKNRAELRAIKRRYGRSFGAELGTDDDAFAGIWNEVRNPHLLLRQLDIVRLPPDAIAYYRPFHIAPFEGWGIYILIDEFLKYCRSITESLADVRSFSPSTLAACVLFESFHHEFFHHMVESAATAIEIINAATGNARPVYLDYCDGGHEEYLGQHPHAPLEEALANAYAFNSFSFITRVKVGYLDRLAALYQEILLKTWAKDPAGYCEARRYIRSSTNAGVAQLLEMLLAGPRSESAPLRALAKSVLPSGHAAFVGKPDIPTYLVGDSGAVKDFYALVPAPLETYTLLFWPGATRELDHHLSERRKEERESKRLRTEGEQLKLIE
jgi:hypothetical protein